METRPESATTNVSQSMQYLLDEAAQANISDKPVAQSVTEIKWLLSVWVPWTECRQALQSQKWT